MNSFPVKFAVVREDANVEISVINNLPQCQKVLTVASGGCTGISIKNLFPHIQVDLIDQSPSQISWVKEKVFQLKETGKFPENLIEAGEFEALFRSLRNFWGEFVLSSEEITQMFLDHDQHLMEQMIIQPYFIVSFQLLFSDALLKVMFGPDAVQHASPDSYGQYFYKQITKAVREDNWSKNPFIQHIFLGKYLETNIALDSQKILFNFINLSLMDFENYSEYDVISISNILDWTNSRDTELLCTRLNKEVKPGGVVIIRQLNNTRELERYFPSFEFKILKDSADNSYFYSKILIGVKREQY